MIGLAENKANSAQAELGLELSLATRKHTRLISIVSKPISILFVIIGIVVVVQKS